MPSAGSYMSVMHINSQGQTLYTYSKIFLNDFKGVQSLRNNTQGSSSLHMHTCMHMDPNIHEHIKIQYSLSEMQSQRMAVSKSRETFTTSQEG